MKELLGEEIISVTTTFTVWGKGIEIQINTRKNYWRQGLAIAIAAFLIVQSLQRGLDSNWDAAYQSSAQLAGKLGYTPQGIYNMWFLTTP